MSNDLERAVLLQFDPTVQDQTVKAQAAAYCEEVKNSHQWLQILAERFNASTYLEVKFWCLQTIADIVPKRYTALDQTCKEELRRVIVTWMLDSKIADQPEMLRNKLAQVVTAVVRSEYPKIWPSFFHDLIGALEQGPAIVDMFCRVMLAIDSDIISQDIHRSVHAQKVSVQLKDAMRESCIESIVDAWYKLVLMYSKSEPELTTLVLQTLQKYISWMSVGLVVNNQFMPLLFELLKLQDVRLQEAAIDCLNEILLKGMEPSTKIHVIQKMGIVPCCATWKDGLPGDEGEELTEKCARLLATLCSEILDCWKHVENSCLGMKACNIGIKNSVKSEANQLCSNCERMIEMLFPAVMAVIRVPDDEISMTVVPFLTAYILRLKQCQERTKMLPEKELETVRNVLNGVLSASRFPSPSEIPPGSYASELQRVSGVEEREAVSAKRRDLFNIFRNIVRIHHEMVIRTLQHQLEIVLPNPDIPFQDVEIVITAVFELGEVHLVASQETGCGPVATLVLPLLRSEIPQRHHQLVSLSILEVHCRYFKIPVHHQQHFPQVISTFVGENGIRHSAECVSDRACYLFMRFVKSCRGVMKPLAMSILDSLGDFLATTLTHPKLKQPSDQVTMDNRLYVFEAAGLLLGIEDLDPQQQKDTLVRLIHPAIRHMEIAMDEGKEEWHLLQSLDAISRISKGFKQEQVISTRPELGSVFTKCLELVLRIPSMMKSVLVYSRVVSFLHRMVELLGIETLPFLQPAFEVLIQECQETGQMKEVVTLAHQLVTAFRESLSSFLSVVLPVLLQRIWMRLEKDWDWTGRTRSLPEGMEHVTNTEGVVLDETRDKDHLQRIYYGLISAIFINGNAQTLLELPFDTLQTMLNTIHQGARFHFEVAVRRVCFQIYAEMIRGWRERIESDGSLRGYVMQEIGQDACLGSTLLTPLDIRDALTCALLQDIAACAHVTWVVCGDEALRLMQVTFHEARLPNEFATELEVRLQSGDVRKLKEFFKTLVQYVSRPTS